MPMATALMVGLVAGGIADSALVAALCACIVLAAIIMLTDTER
jgi:hypothetical protein